MAVINRLNEGGLTSSFKSAARKQCSAYDYKMEVYTTIAQHRLPTNQPWRCYYVASNNARCTLHNQRQKLSTQFERNRNLPRTARCRNRLATVPRSTLWRFRYHQLDQPTMNIFLCAQRLRTRFHCRDELAPGLRPRIVCEDRRSAFCTSKAVCPWRWLHWGDASNLGATTTHLPLTIYALYAIAACQACAVKVMFIKSTDTNIDSFIIICLST